MPLVPSGSDDGGGGRGGGFAGDGDADERGLRGLDGEKRRKRGSRLPRDSATSRPEDTLT